MDSSSPQRAQGFSLIELMIVLGIVAIMASIAIPSFTRMIRTNRIVTVSNSLKSAIALTRSEAINRGSSMSICVTDDPTASPLSCSAGTNNWANGWIIFPAATGVTSAIRVGMPNEGVSMLTPGVDTVTFDNRGVPSGSGGISVFPSPCNDGVDSQVIVSFNATGLITTALAPTVSGDCP